MTRKTAPVPLRRSGSKQGRHLTAGRPLNDLTDGNSCSHLQNPRIDSPLGHGGYVLRALSQALPRRADGRTIEDSHVLRLERGERASSKDLCLSRARHTTDRFPSESRGSSRKWHSPGEWD